MTKSELRKALIARGSHFFDRDTMRYYGDTMASFHNKVEVATYDGIECYVLKRKEWSNWKPLIYHFRTDTLNQVWITAKDEVAQ